MNGKLYAGASGFSYSSWKGGFYPADAKAEDFLHLYAERVNAVELNNTFYRVPPDGQFDRWAAQVPDGFRFAVTMTRSLTGGGRVREVDAFCRMAKQLGAKLGPLRIKVPQARDDGFLRLLLDSLDPDVPVALDFRHESWHDPEVAEQLDARGVASVERREGATPFRYLRLREPPYDEAALAAFAAEIRPLLAEADVYAFFRHEDEPTAPLYAERLRALVEE